VIGGIVAIEKIMWSFSEELWGGEVENTDIQLNVDIDSDDRSYYLTSVYEEIFTLNGKRVLWKERDDLYMFFYDVDAGSKLFSDIVSDYMYECSKYDVDDDDAYWEQIDLRIDEMKDNDLYDDKY